MRVYQLPAILQQIEMAKARARCLYGYVGFRRADPFSHDERRLCRERFRGGII
jgi:hypothetical protein